MTLIYRKPGNAYTSAVVCTLEGEEIVIRDGSSVTRMEKTGGVILRIAEICAEDGLELGRIGLELRTKWLNLQEVKTARAFDKPDFDAVYIGKGMGSQLHKELARAGHGQGYAFCSTLLDRSIVSLALLTLEELCAVRDAIVEQENDFLERSYVPEVSLTNPAHGSYRIILDPNQSGVSARAKRFFQ